MRPWRNSLPFLGLFSLLGNKQVGLIDFWCPASTNILEYSRGLHTCPDEANLNTLNFHPGDQLGSGEIPDHISYSRHSGTCPVLRSPASLKRPAAQALTQSDSVLESPQQLP